jgi:hypothetical protein
MGGCGVVRWECEQLSGFAIMMCAGGIDGAAQQMVQPRSRPMPAAGWQPAELRGGPRQRDPSGLLLQPPLSLPGPGRLPGGAQQIVEMEVVFTGNSKLQQQCRPPACRRRLPDGSPQSIEEEVVLDGDQWRVEVVLASELPAIYRPTAGQLGGLLSGSGQQGADYGVVEASDLRSAPCRSRLPGGGPQCVDDGRVEVGKHPTRPRPELGQSLLPVDGQQSADYGAVEPGEPMQ